MQTQTQNKPQADASLKPAFIKAPDGPLFAEAPKDPIELLSAREVAMLRMADSALVHSQRIAQWCGHGPMLEEDLAFTNVSLDLLGQARMVYQHLSSLPGAQGPDEDWYAYFRNEKAFFNVSLVELPNGLTMSSGPREDYAVALARLFLSTAFYLPMWAALREAPYAPLAEIAQKAVKEARYHWDHASQWMLRMGDGTAESNRRAQAALDRVWPYAQEMFVDDAWDVQAAADTTGIVPSALAPKWNEMVDSVLAEAGLKRPPASKMLSNGKRGVHSEAMGFLLAEMQTLARQHPGAQW